MGRIPKSADVVQQQRSISIKNAIEKYRLEMWSDDPVGIPTPTKITTDDYDKMKEHYLNDLIVRRNQRVHQEDENKDAIDLFASSLTSLRDKLKRAKTKKERESQEKLLPSCDTFLSMSDKPQSGPM